MTRALFLLIVLSVTVSCSGALPRATNSSEDLEMDSESGPAESSGNRATKPDLKVLKEDPRSQTETAAAGSKVGCRSGNDSRVVELKIKQAGCSVEYTKQSIRREVASATIELQYCNTVYARIKGRLEAAGYDCN